MILDATAGNRTLWRYKKSKHVIYIDIEKKLDVKPTIFANSEKTPFKNETFATIIYDPPHNWGGAIHYFSFPSKAERKKVFKKASGIPTYYGWDKYKTKQKLITHMYHAQKEFQRILKPDGLLWLKWNEMKILIEQVMSVFHEWTELIKLYVNAPTHTAGQHQTFWICMCKPNSKSFQRGMLEFL